MGDIKRAIAAGALEKVKALVADGYALDTVETEQGWCALHLAVEHEQTDIVSFLIVSGADLHAADKNGFTPLHLAVDVEADGAIQAGTKPRPNVSRLLVKAGADAHACDANRQTPETIAEGYGYHAFLALIDRSVGA